MSRVNFQRYLLSGLLSAMLITGSATIVLAEAHQEDEAREIARSLACPVCQGQSLADSPAPLARQMRALVRKKLAQGESREQILQYFVDRYGEAILREPPKSGFNQVLWWLPVLSFAGGIGLLALFLYRWQDRRQAVTSPLNVGIPEELAAYERRFEKEFEREATGNLRR